ncbi:unnamed protein product [Symbiodinium pilosum]|uniref:Actin-fragmin kinase catalytic domain-containing protein n=1 Tax=Symbiodinium pilosum TaxID=2952 RepID=A0A812YIL0_SYMPI|nr:unnamed protein product [Symbiodinium pilosum]
MPRPKVGAQPPPPPKAKPKAIKWSERQQAERRLQRLLSFQIVQKWRGDASSACLGKLDWSAIESVVYIAGGSGGVMLARFNGPPGPPRLCCLKPQRMEAAGELCASILANALQVRTAPLQVVPMSSDTEQAIREAQLAIDDHRVYLDRLLAGAKHLGVVEFVHGPMMEGQEFVQFFEEGSGRLDRFWFEAGILVAFDCLINNLDRLPIIWDNAGNLKNLMVEPDSGGLKVVGIDQAVRGISAASGLERYVEQLRQLLQVVLGSDTDWLESPFLLRVQRAMQANFQDKFTVHAPALKLGLRQAFRQFAWRWCSGALGQSLDEALNQVMATFGGSAAQVGPLRQLVEVAAATIAEEVEKIELGMMPGPVLKIFRKLIPSGQLTWDELVRLLHLLDPQLEGDQVKKFLSNAFSEPEVLVDCSEFLLLIWEGRPTVCQASTTM